MARSDSFAFNLSPGRFALVLGLLIFAAFPKVLLGMEAFFFRDYGVLGYPFVFYHRECFWRGELPLWNPLSNCGAPFLGQWGTMTLYPLSLIYLLLPLPWSLGFFCLLHLFLGGMGMYFLARRFTGDDFAGAFAGTAFVFNGVVFSALLWPNYTVALGWMPWLVLASERAWQHGGRAMVIAALVGALQMLSGVPELIVFTWVIVGVLWLTAVAQRRQATSTGLRLGVVVLLVAGLSACQLLPFLDSLSHSHRTTDTGGTKWAMPGWGWANLLVPFFHTYQSYHGVVFQHEQAFMSSYYPGVGVAVLAAWAAWRVRSAQILGLGVLVLGSYILALGPHGKIYSWVKEAAPMIGFARFPVKFVLVAAFLVPLLAALAIPRLQREPHHRTPHSLRVLAAVAFLLMAVLVWFAWKYPFPLQNWTELWQNSLTRLVLTMALLGACTLACKTEDARVRNVAMLCCLLLIATDAVTHTKRQNPTIESSAFVPGIWAQRYGQQGRPTRVAITPMAEERLLRGAMEKPLHDYLSKRLALWSNLNLLESIAKVNGSSTLPIREQKHLEQILYPTNRHATARWSMGLLDFLGVTHLTGTNINDWTRRTTALPLVTCGQQPVFAPDSTALEKITSADFEPHARVYLPEDVRQACVATGAGEARLGGLKFGAQRVTFQVQCDEATLVVIAQSFHHNWKATVNGVEVPLWRANYAFQSLQVPAGRHEVVLQYRDMNFAMGACVSVLALGICVLLWRKRRDMPVQSVEPAASRVADEAFA